VLLLLGDGTSLEAIELPGRGPWTFLLLTSAPDVPGAPGPPSGPGPRAPASADPEPPGAGDGAVAWFLTRFGRVVVPDLRGRPGWGGPAGAPGDLDLVDDLDQVRTRAGLGRPILVGLGGTASLALRAAAEQPWAWRALILAPPAGGPAATSDPDQPGLPVLVLAAGPPPPGQAEAVERLLGRLGGGPGWSGIAPDAPPR
jgi:pimeloyl-ACP methyl ester carboxylesterase